MKTPAILLRQVLITFQKRVWWIFNWSNQEFCERRYSCFGRRAIQPSPGVSISVWGFKYASLLFIGSVIRGYYRFLSGVGPPNIYYFVCNQNYYQRIYPHKISQHIHIWNGPQKMSMWNFHMNSEHPSSPHLNRQNFVQWFVWFVRRKGDQVAKYPDGQSCHHMCLKVVVPFWGRTSP